MLGFLHVCQEGPWASSWSILEDYLLKNTSLVSQSSALYVCIVKEDPNIDRSFLEVLAQKWPDVQIVTMYLGSPQSYERVTLQFMKSIVSSKNPDDLVWYMHTKGLRWFGSPFETRITQWMHFLCSMMHVHGLSLYVRTMREDPNLQAAGPDFRLNSPIYGHCPHFSGNYWIARASHIQQRPYQIGSRYIDPEFWLLDGLSKTDLATKVLTHGRSCLDHYQQIHYGVPDIWWTRFLENRTSRDRMETSYAPLLAPESSLS